MCVVKLLTAVVLAIGETTAAHCQPAAFYSARISDSQTVNLFLDSRSAATESGFDFDVMIGVQRIANAGSDFYADPSSHKAVVRCYEPSLVMLGGRAYDVAGLDTADWKAALWAAVCAGPVS
jgi:hypothetical protein